MGSVDLSQIKIRTFGWVQDSGKFENLKATVSVFDKNSSIHNNLVTTIIPKLVQEDDGRDRFLRELTKDPLRLSYNDLTGTSFTPRSSARCNGIIQAAIKGQIREYISDWPADNFVRWAHCLGFIKYNYEDDTFEITPLGTAYSQSISKSKEEKEFLTQGLLSYPPTMRVLNLLSDGSHLTKFEIGSKLGFVGEDGFTTLPQKILIISLNNLKDAKEKNKMKTDWDGSADKYARMICGWLIHMGWVTKVAKTVTVQVGGKTYQDEIGQAYIITSNGLKARRKGLGDIRKNIYWESFSTKSKDRIYIRTRRSYILKILEAASKVITSTEICQKLSKYGITDSEKTVEDDINGLINLGLNIRKVHGGYNYCDTITDFVIPSFAVSETQKSDLLMLKDKCRERLHCIPHDYLSLIDIAFDSEQNRQFEMQTIDLFVSECDFEGTHLGGSRKPDGIIYKTTLKRGLIIDNKAYSKGYNVPIHQADEMERYIRENQTRSEAVNPNKWWDNFPKAISNFNFTFISSMFKGNFKDQLSRIYLNTGVKGAALNAYNLLLLAEEIKSGSKNQSQALDLFDTNEEIVI